MGTYDNDFGFPLHPEEFDYPDCPDWLDEGEKLVNEIYETLKCKAPPEPWNELLDKAVKCINGLMDEIEP